VSHCQADQLAVAVRSPIAAQEDQHRGGVKVIRKPPRLCFLVGEGEIGQHPLTIACGRLAGFAVIFAVPARSGHTMWSLEHCPARVVAAASTTREVTVADVSSRVRDTD